MLKFRLLSQTEIDRFIVGSIKWIFLSFRSEIWQRTGKVLAFLYALLFIDFVKD